MLEPTFRKVLNIAHRGARSLAPENTLAAARKAYEIGADMWELDVCMTKDGEMILLHDDTLERTSNAAEIYPRCEPWKVTDFTFGEVRRLDFGSWFIQRDPLKQIAAGNVSTAEQSRYVSESAPTLREALEFTRVHHWRVNIEIKDMAGSFAHSIIVTKVVELIRELGMEEDVLISSFNHDYLHQVKEQAPEIKTGVLVEHGHPDPVKLVGSLGAQAYNPKFGEVTPVEIARLRESGVDVFVYTVNDPKDMRMLVEAQATGIFTDFPQTLKEILEVE